ncbi:MAG: ABC transporter permease subunit [Clostridiales bacterium]|nr:ABC transporter permease subunit [Clostridiales bacterium]
MSLTKAKQPAKKKSGSNGSSFDNLEIFLLHLPTTVWYLIFCYAPMFGVIIAFKNYKPRPGKSFLWALMNNSKWVGIDNFKFLFKSSYFPIMLKTTILYNIVFIILGIIIPVTLAILFNEIYSKKLAKSCQTMMFLPHFLSWVVVSYFVYAFLATDNGLINRAFHIIDSATGQNHNWYHDTIFWMYFLVFLNVWKGMGYNMVVYMASISGIDGELYEAALIDGASKSQQVKYITLPLLRPTISIMFIMAVGNIFRSDFGLFYQATRNSGALTSVTQTIDVYVYKALLEQSNVNLSSAAAFLQSTVGCITIVAANLIVKKIDPEAGLF